MRRRQPSRARRGGLGYNLAIHGQKTFNGVAILSKYPFDEVGRACPVRMPTSRRDSSRRRFRRGRLARVASIYLPNGNPVDSEKYPYKIRWMERIYNYISEVLKLEDPLILAGRLQRHSGRGGRLQSSCLDRRCIVPAADPGRVPLHHQSRTDRRAARHHRRSRALHVLGLPGRRLAEEQRHSDRPYPALAAGRRPARDRRHRPARARLGKTLGPRSGVDRTGIRSADIDPAQRCRAVSGACSPHEREHAAPPPRSAAAGAVRNRRDGRRRHLCADRVGRRPRRPARAARLRDRRDRDGADGRVLRRAMHTLSGCGRRGRLRQGSPRLAPAVDPHGPRDDRDRRDRVGDGDTRRRRLHRGVHRPAAAARRLGRRDRAGTGVGVGHPSSRWCWQACSR